MHTKLFICTGWDSSWIILLQRYMLTSLRIYAETGVMWKQRLRRVKTIWLAEFDELPVRGRFWTGKESRQKQASEAHTRATNLSITSTLKFLSGPLEGIDALLYVFAGGENRFRFPHFFNCFFKLPLTKCDAASPWTCTNRTLSLNVQMETQNSFYSNM